MNKSKDKKTKPFNKTFNQTLVEVSNTYDGTNYIYDGLDDTINTEQDMIKKYSKSMEEVKNQPFVKNKKPLAQQRGQSRSLPKPQVPLKLDPKFPQIEKEVLHLLDEDKTLERLEEARNKPSPEFFRGLGTFLPKKI